MHDVVCDRSTMCVKLCVGNQRCRCTLLVMEGRQYDTSRPTASYSNQPSISTAMPNLVVCVTNALFATSDSSQTGFHRTHAAHPSRQMITLAKPLFTEKTRSDDEGIGNLFAHPKR